MRHLFLFLFAFLTIFSFGQNTTLEGYIYETGNRGYINQVDITIDDLDADKLLAKTTTNADGFFSVEIPYNTKIRLYAAKDMFDVKKIDLEVENKAKMFVKLEMGRSVGYSFEVTLAEKRDNENIVVDAIEGARIEVYNNTKRTSVMDLKEHMSPEFQLNLKEGNHYTILIRKEGYLSKRMEAYVNVEGCILCFEGVGEVSPGVSDNLTENNAFGVLLANVELEKIFEGKKMEVQNLYYASAKYRLTKSAKTELNKVITLMKDNPNLTLELGSHTDSQGGDETNMRLSRRRASTAVDYLINTGGVKKSRIVSKGYGEQKLLNECKDGVRCSKEKHAENRRTELKIVGITNVAEIKSLKKMKEEEYMEEEILKLMDQNEVRINSEEELTKLKEGNISIFNDGNVMINSTNPNDSDMLAVELVDETKDDAKTATKTKIKDQSEVFENAEASIQEVKKETAKERVARQRAEMKRLKEEYKKKKHDMSSTSEVGYGNANLPPVVKNEDSGPMKILDDMTGLTVIDHRLGNANGAKVIIYHDRMPLSKTHKIFQRHDNLEIYKGPNSRLHYMIGGFRDVNEAWDFYESYIAKTYRGSFVADFNEGVMTKIDR